MTSPLIDRDRIRFLLIELGSRLAARGLEARIFLVGGAAMALAYSRTRITRDLDAVFEPKREICDEVARMADEFGLPDGWLNDGVKAGQGSARRGNGFVLRARYPRRCRVS